MKAIAGTIAAWAVISAVLWFGIIHPPSALPPYSQPYQPPLGHDLSVDIVWWTVIFVCASVFVAVVAYQRGKRHSH